MKEKHILIAEDDPDIIEGLSLYLNSAGFVVSAAENGIEALELFHRETFALALIDIMMPLMNGYELISAIRKESNLPIIVISAKNLDSDKILGLDIGADAYITKPFNPLEVLAYVKALYRRYYQLGAGSSEETENKTIVLGELELDPQKLELTKRGKPILLTATEYKIISKLMHSPGRVFTKAQIYETINGEFFENDSNTMMVHISNLRAKIEDDFRTPRYIKTVRGLGYKFEAY